MYNNCETRASYLATVSPVVVSIAVVYPPERLNMLMSLPASHSATCTRAEIDDALLLDPTDLLPITLCFGLSLALTPKLSHHFTSSSPMVVAYTRRH
jgi:hypothetical protein